jgi:hypothetical protein
MSGGRPIQDDLATVGDLGVDLINPPIIGENFGITRRYS